LSETKSVNIMSALAIMAMVKDTVLPALGRDGATVNLIWDPTVALMKRIADGETADGIVAIDWALDELASKGLIDTDSRRSVAQAVVGLAVRAGAPRPDISTEQALRNTLLATRSLVVSKAGASGIYFDKLIDRLGIGDAVRSKTLVIPRGLTGERLAAGEVEMAIQQLSELMVVPGIDVVGSFPAEVQATTNFGAAVFIGANEPSGAARFIDALLTDDARDAYRRTGLVPLF
jgi:molybdate transport system substrate-binding protein